MDMYKSGQLVCPEINYPYIAGLDIKNSESLKSFIVMTVDSALLKSKSGDFMMSASFIYDNVLKRCLKSGASQTESTNAAVMACDDYKKGKYKKVGDMIDKYVSQAVKNTKMANFGKLPIKHKK